MQPHPLRKNLVCHFPSLSTRERGRERQGERGKREHVTMVTDSVAPRPSAKMLGHIQHPSVPAVCVCACVYHVFVCSLRWSGTPGEREPLTAKKVSHLFPDMYSLHTHTHTHLLQNRWGRRCRTRMVTGCVPMTFQDLCVCVCVQLIRFINSLQREHTSYILLTKKGLRATRTSVPSCQNFLSRWRWLQKHHYTFLHPPKISLNI